MEVMNLYSATMDTFRRFATRHRHPRIVEKRTYVFILVPFDFSKDGSAKKAEVAAHLFDNHIDSGARRETITGLTALDRPQIGASAGSTNGRDVNHEPKLNFDLMWTWFLPNPLGKPKRRE
jgi:hypothetical protein